jgi:hypothetical protein
MRSTKFTLAILLAAAPLAACGSSGSSSGTNAASTNSNNKALAFSQCMRSHGVPNFPDPSGGRLNLRLQASPNGTTVNGVTVNGPAFKSAMSACKADLPNGGKPSPPSASQRAAALKFAQCMRTHGMPNFPDPQLSGAGAIIKSVDPNSPAFKSAQQACQPLMKAAFTRTGGP